MSSTGDSSVSPKIITEMLVIENLSKIANYKENDFSVGGISVCLGLFPNKTFVLFESENCFVYLCLYSKASVHYKVSILNDEEVKLYTSEYDWNFDGKCGNHFAKFITHAQLVNTANGYVNNDKLILLYEIEILNQEKSAKCVKQQELNDLSENFKSLLLDEKFSDVTLIVGGTDTEKNQFNVHKNILAARSPVFAAMFEHDFEEKRESKVKITDIAVDVFKEFVRFIYTGKVESLDQYAMELLEAADKYQVNSLKTICEQYLSSNLTIETVAQVLVFADLYRASELKSSCIDFIGNNPAKMKDTEGWKVLSSSKPQLLSELFFHVTSKMKN